LADDGVGVEADHAEVEAVELFGIQLRQVAMQAGRGKGQVGGSGHGDGFLLVERLLQLRKEW
jgi:hypothetical protein